MSNVLWYNLLRNIHHFFYFSKNEVRDYVT